ncbi:MAG: hypothetical protein R3A10_01955 [Caldilineaceae bacterium]
MGPLPDLAISRSHDRRRGRDLHPAPGRVGIDLEFAYRAATKRCWRPS